MRLRYQFALLLGLLVSGPGCSGVSSDLQQGTIKSIDTETGEIRIDNRDYVIASRAWIYGSDKGLIKRMHLNAGMRIKFRVTKDSNGNSQITEIQMNASSVDLQGLR